MYACQLCLDKTVTNKEDRKKRIEETKNRDYK